MNSKTLTSYFSSSCYTLQISFPISLQNFCNEDFYACHRIAENYKRCYNSSLTVLQMCHVPTLPASLSCPSLMILLPVHEGIALKSTKANAKVSRIATEPLLSISSESVVVLRIGIELILSSNSFFLLLNPRIVLIIPGILLYRKSGKYLSTCFTKS